MTGGTVPAEGGPGAPGRALSAAEFVVAASGRRPVVVEQALTLIREDELPGDWLATTVDCYSTEAGYYELAQYGNTQPLKTRVNEYAADAIDGTAAEAVLDVGVGDGHRLAQICSLVGRRRGRTPEMFGIELSEQMVERARQRGVHTIQQDMREGIPDLGRELDGILFLSGDLGYLMDPVAGYDMRSTILDSAHDRLRVGGRVVLELISRDPRESPDGADVFYFSRIPRMRDDDAGDVFYGPETWQYIKTFSKPEVVELIERSRFELAASALRYIVRDSSDVRRIGHFVSDDELSADETYRLLVTLVKGR